MAIYNPFNTTFCLLVATRHFLPRLSNTLKLSNPTQTHLHIILDTTTLHLFVYGILDISTILWNLTLRLLDTKFAAPQHWKINRTESGVWRIKFAIAFFITAASFLHRIWKQGGWKQLKSRVGEKQRLAMQSRVEQGGEENGIGDNGVYAMMAVVAFDLLSGLEGYVGKQGVLQLFFGVALVGLLGWRVVKEGWIGWVAGKARELRGRDGERESTADSKEVRREGKEEVLTEGKSDVVDGRKVRTESA